MNASYPSQPQPAYPQPGSQPLPPLALPLEVWGATDKGREREGNEDAIYPHSGSDTFPFKPGAQRLVQKGQLIVVADGVGGAQAGREASQWAIRGAVERYYDLSGPDVGADLRTAVEHANASLFQYLQNTHTPEAGSTMVAAVIHGNVLYVANVGDSRAYLIRNGGITRLTRDHTLTQRKIDQGLIQPDQAELDPDRSVLTRSLGAGPTVQVDLFPPLQLAQGDMVLLCSDGLADMVSDEEVARLVAGSSPKRAAQRLIATANRRGGFDNISVIVVQVGKRPAAASVGLLESVKLLPRQRKIMLLVGSILVAAALCAMAALGWKMWPGRATMTPASAPTATVETMPTATSAPVIVPETPRPTDTVPAGMPTSTPAPTVTPTFTPVPDRDHDHVLDHNDDCPDEPGLPEFRGCPDSDKDGIPDRDDECPEQPGPLELKGCPATDTDGDGIPDNQDTCPTQSGPVENGGCPPTGDDGGGNGDNNNQNPDERTQ